MSELLLLLAIAAAGWLWWDGNRAREIAREAGRAACARSGMQFLDDTVALRRLRPTRDGDGRLVFARDYGFEFTRYGERRWRGEVRMVGPVVTGVELETPAD